MLEITINEIGDGERIQVYSQRVKCLDIPMVVRAILESAAIAQEHADALARDEYPGMIKEVDHLPGG